MTKHPAQAPAPNGAEITAQLPAQHVQKTSHGTAIQSQHARKKAPIGAVQHTEAAIVQLLPAQHVQKTSHGTAMMKIHAKQ